MTPLLAGLMTCQWTVVHLGENCPAGLPMSLLSGEESYSFTEWTPGSKELSLDPSLTTQRHVLSLSASSYITHGPQNSVF